MDLLEHELSLTANMCSRAQTFFMTYQFTQLWNFLISKTLPKQSGTCMSWNQPEGFYVYTRRRQHHGGEFEVVNVFCCSKQYHSRVFRSSSKHIHRMHCMFLPFLTSFKQTYTFPRTDHEVRDLVCHWARLERKACIQEKILGETLRWEGLSLKLKLKLKP